MPRLLAFIQRNQHRLSTLVFVTGFVTDLITFTLLDLPVVNLLFIGYLAAAALFTFVTHVMGRYATEPSGWRRSVAVLSTLAANFTIGGLLSGFLIFYSKSAEFTVSWPFLLLLAAIFFGNEFFRSYRSHLVFQTVLFFFALYAYLIFALPLYVDRLGPEVFLWSTGLAVGVFAAFICLLGFAGRERLEETLWRIVLGAAAVVVAVVLSYFTGLVPPIPLTVKDSGIYHDVVHTEKGYEVTYEGSSRWSRFLPRTVHHASGTPLYAYSAIFAPSAFSANVVHRWERYDEANRKWVTQSMVAFTLSGGREGGYRGYSIKDNPEAGNWRVTIETTEGQVIGRLRFEVESVQALPVLYVNYR
ncbi:MAG: hypothetical protein QOE22_118 [Candidatus Parcubacteria bacterium]|jgi:MFS family permease|nr:hypothetical protein [Candidatus Parcubacteria bacterium]